MAWLLSLGMTLTLLGVTGLLRHGWMAAMALLALAGLLSAASLNRRLALGTGCVVLFAGLVWLIIGGAGLIVEVFRALTLHMSGLTTALPMVGKAFTVIVAVLCMTASWFVTQRSAGAYPALILLVLIAVLLWLGGWQEVLLCLLPAAFSCVTLLLRAGDEHTSTLRVLPLAAAVTAIAFAGVAAGGAVSEPLKKLADDLRQRIYDTFFYTQPRDVFTLASEGYYPQGINQLGGPAEPREEPVMAVITPRKAYLRGVIKNVYTGRTWVDNIGGRRYLWSAPRFEALRTTTFEMNLPSLTDAADASLIAPRTLRVRMLRDGASTMFVPQRIRQLQTDGELIPYFNGSSEIFATANLKVGDVWTMDACLFTSEDSGLRPLVQAAGDADDPNWDDVCDRYLQLPEHLQQEVFDIAAQAVGGAETPYDQALAIQRFLAANYVYNLEVPEQNPEQDFVSTFLLIGKEGYCTYFASAMTVMCRMVGLPARYVEGYVAYPDAEGMAIVTGKEGHAWTEVYFRGFGWVTFDATPISVAYSDLPPDAYDGSEEPPEPEQTPDPSAMPSLPPSEQPTPTPVPEGNLPQQPEASPESHAPAGETEQDASRPPSGAGWFLLVLALALIALRAAYVQPDVRVKFCQTEFERWLVYTQASYDVLRCQGFVREKTETPSLFLARAEGSGKLPISLRGLADAQNLMFYGHASPFEEEVAQARENFRALYAPLNVWQKGLFQLQRVFLPSKLRDITAR